MEHPLSRRKSGSLASGKVVWHEVAPHPLPSGLIGESTSAPDGLLVFLGERLRARRTERAPLRGETSGDPSSFESGAKQRDR